jgi:hypothetical protein
MARRFERHGLGLLLAFLLVLGGLQQIASGQGNKVDLPTAVKEAQQAGVPTVTVNQLLSLGYANQVESSAMAGYLQALTEIQREKLPLEPFVNKIEEGVAKRVSSQGIHQALMKKREDYRFTESTIKETLRKHKREQTIPTEDLVRLSETLSCGISRENLHFYVEHSLPSSSYQHLAITLDNVAILEQNRFDPGMTKKIALAAIGQNYFSPEKRDFARVAVVAKKKGIPDATITSVSLETIQKKGSPKDLALRLGVKAEDLARGPMMDQERSRAGKKGEADPERVGESGTHGPGSSDRGEQGSSEGSHGDSGSGGDQGGGGDRGGGNGEGGGHGGGGKK